MRNDAGVGEGDEISMFYDPMIAKLCTWAPTREAAIDGMARALEDFNIEGVGHNVPFLSAVMEQPRFRSGKITTGYIAEEFPGGFQGLAPTAAQRDLMIAAAALVHQTLEARSDRPGVRRGDWIALFDGEAVPVRLSHDGDALLVELTAEGRGMRLDGVDWRPGRSVLRGVLDGTSFSVRLRPASRGVKIEHRAARARVLLLRPFEAELYARLPKKAAADTSKQVISPMPGLVVAMEVAVGDTVKEGQTLAIIEAMKMQNLIRSERDGVVKRVGAGTGDSVATDDILVEFA